MQAVVVESSTAEPTIIDRERPEPGDGEVRIKVEVCGLCGGDLAVLEGAEGIEYPRIPGHEIAGWIDATGSDVPGWSVGDRVAVGWHGGHCFDCEQCRHGRFTTCADKRITGISRDGGLAEWTLARPEALAAVPDKTEPADAASLVCAGLTAYNALRNSTATPGDVVAIQGIGGVGHMGVQFAAAMGFEVIALSHGAAKRDPANRLGAHGYVDTSEEDPADALSERGGADVIMTTVPSAGAMESVIGGLAPEGELLLVGAPDQPLEVEIAPLLDDRLTIRGWSAGHPGDAEDTFAMAANAGIDPWIEAYALDSFETAIERMTEDSARFRTVIEP